MEEAAPRHDPSQTSSLTVRELIRSRVPTPEAEFQIVLFENSRDHKEHLALVLGDLGDGHDILCRVHSECFTGDVLGSLRCDCGEQLNRSMERIAQEGRGVLLYLRQEGRGIGLLQKLRAYNLQDQGMDTVDANLALGHQADERRYDIAARMLEALGVRSVQLLTNNPHKVESLEAEGIRVVGRMALTPETVTSENARYLAAKASRMRHLLDLGAFLPVTTPEAPEPKEGGVL